MYDHESLPTRMYRYGARPPVEGAERVEEQMRQAHRYKNAIIHHERIRRRKVDRALAALSPALAEVEKSLPALEEAVNLAEVAIKNAHIGARERTRPPELVRKFQDAKRALKEARDKRKVLRAELFASPEWAAVSEEIKAWATKYTHKLRAVCGLYSGTYLHVEQSMSKRGRGAPPKFARWDGDGHIAVQIQPKGGKGKGETRQTGRPLYVAEAMAGSDTRLRIDPVPPEAWEKGGRRLQRTRVHVRVGSDGRAPVWAVFPIVLHRPIPADARIKWVHVIRRRIAAHCEWSVQFALSRASGWERTDVAQSGRVGVDVGWRKRPDGSLRVAYWVDDAGEEGELCLPPDWLEQMQKTRDIQSIRDQNRDGILAALVEGLKPLPNLPDKVREILPFLHQIKSHDRLSRFIDAWRTGFRFPGDEKVFEQAEAWRKRNKHLHEYEANLRHQLQGRRKDIYRVFAARFRKKYKTIAVECLDLRDFHELPDADQPMPSEAVKEYVRSACLSALFDAIKQSGMTVEKLPAPYTTLIHATCGSIQEFDRTRLYNVCTVCGERYDQDRNAAINLLRGSSAPVPAAIS